MNTPASESRTKIDHVASPGDSHQLFFILLLLLSVFPKSGRERLE